MSEFEGGKMPSVADLLNNRLNVGSIMDAVDEEIDKEMKSARAAKLKERAEGIVQSLAHTINDHIQKQLKLQLQLLEKGTTEYDFVEALAFFFKQSLVDQHNPMAKMFEESVMTGKTIMPWGTMVDPALPKNPIIQGCDPAEEEAKQQQTLANMLKAQSDAMVHNLIPPDRLFDVIGENSVLDAEKVFSRETKEPEKVSPNALKKAINTIFKKGQQS